MADKKADYVVRLSPRADVDLDPGDVGIPFHYPVVFGEDDEGLFPVPGQYGSFRELLKSTSEDWLSGDYIPTTADDMYAKVGQKYLFDKPGKLILPENAKTADVVRVADFNENLKSKNYFVLDIYGKTIAKNQVKSGVQSTTAINLSSLQGWRVFDFVYYSDYDDWAIREFKRNGTKIIDLYRWSDPAPQTTIYTPRAASGHEALTSLQIVDNGGETVITNLYASVTDAGNPMSVPAIEGKPLQVGDRFRFQTTAAVSSLFTYQGIDAATGAWWAKPVIVATDPSLVLHTWLDPILDRHGLALDDLDRKVAVMGNTITRFENCLSTQQDCDGTWHIWESAEVTGNSAVVSTYKWGGPLLPNEFFKVSGPHTIPITFDESLAKYDGVTKLWTIPINGLDFQYSKDLTSLKYQLPGADSKFSNLAYTVYAADGTEIGGGGYSPVFDSTNPNYQTNISANPTLAAGRPIAKIKFRLTPIGGGADVVYEVNL